MSYGVPFLKHKVLQGGRAGRGRDTAVKLVRKGEGREETFNLSGKRIGLKEREFRAILYLASAQAILDFNSKRTEKGLWWAA